MIPIDPEKESICSYVVARKLKHIGFDWPCITCCIEKDNYVVYPQAAIYTNYNEHHAFISLPTHQMALRWLFETHGIFIEIRAIPIYENEQRDRASDVKFEWNIKEIRGDSVSNDKRYDTYQEAFENAMLYTLNYLI